MTVAEAADRLGVRPGTIRRLIRCGAPVVRRGRRGRGCSTLIDVGALAGWIAASPCDAVILSIASELPQALAEDAEQALLRADGISKNRLAGILAAHWYMNATTVLDHLRERCPAVPDVRSIPEPIERLRKIAR